MTTPFTRQRAYSLDVVRGLAASSVLVLHWSLWTSQAVGRDAQSTAISALARVLSLGWKGAGIHPGVVIFIVLSGFCIHLPVAAGLERTERSGFWSNFALRRFVRIYPVYVVGLALGLMSALIVAEPSITRDGLLISWSGTGALAQLAAIAGSSWPKDVWAGNGPLSTVAVEMLLYCAYPGLLVLARRIGATVVSALALLLYIVWASLAFHGISAELLHGTFLEFLLYWVLGAVAVEFAIYEMRAPVRRTGRWRVAAIVSASAYLAYNLLIEVRGAHFGGTLLLAICASITLGLLVLEETRLETDSRWRRLLEVCGRIGERSYSLYVVHTPVLVLFIWWWSAASAPVVRWGSLGLVLLMAELCFRAVERPCHRLARRLRHDSVANVTSVPAVSQPR
ncbi:MAG: acyltransferase [Gemmatimonadaceae bacterium]